MKKCTKVALWCFGIGIAITAINDINNPGFAGGSANENANNTKADLFTPDAQKIFKFLVSDDVSRSVQGKSALYLPPIKHASASQIINAYKNNEPRAERDYRNKTVLITGTVRKIEQSITGTNYLVFRTGDFSQLRADFDDSQNDAALDIDPGDSVSIICTVKGTSLGVTSADDCSFSNDWKNYQADYIYRNAMELLRSGYPFGGTSDEQEKKLKAIILSSIMASKMIKESNACPKGMTDKCIKKTLIKFKNSNFFDKEEAKSLSKELGFLK